MSITTGNDFDRTSISNELVGLYYYYLSQSKVNGNESSVLGFCPTIQSASYNPFIDEDDLNLLECNFDTSRFGTPNGGIPKCYRILSNPKIEKTLKTIPLEFNVDEPVLSTYPFKYWILFDGFNQPLLIKPQYVNDTTLTVKAKTYLNQNSKYCLYVNKYKGDSNGNIEGIVNTFPMLAPVTSSAYSQFLATSSSKYNEQNNISLMENEVMYNQKLDSANLQYKQSLVGGIVNSGLGLLGSAMTGNVGGILSSIAGGISNTVFAGQNLDLTRQQASETKQLTDYSIERMELATVSDYLKTPRAIKTLGNDLFFNMNLNNKMIYLYEYGVAPQQQLKIKKFLKRFGYLVNDYLSSTQIDIRSRKYWNFIKFTKCEIEGDTIPREHIEEMKEIFQSGVTFWHVNNGVNIKDYSKDNIERWK